MKKIVALFLALSLMFSLTGCDLQDMAKTKLEEQINGEETLYSEDDSEENLQAEDEDADVNSEFPDMNAPDMIMEDGDDFYSGELGTVMSGEFFDFQVIECKESKTYDGEMAEYADYVPAEGNMLMNVVVNVKDTCEDHIIENGTYGMMMFDNDFYIVARELSDTPPSLGADIQESKDNEWLMTKGEMVTRTLVYEVPAETDNFAFIYDEVFSDDTTGESFALFLNVEHLEG
ncbi:MAG: hypothetical protein RR052_03725 [Oscillospiraceae bacterium]